MPLLSNKADREVRVAITIGCGLEIAITERKGQYPALIIRECNDQSGDAVFLGSCTKTRIDQLIENLQRVRIHAED